MNLEHLKDELPPILTRQMAAAASGGAFTRGTLANLDSKGQGPKRAILGGKAVYMRDDYIEWLAGRISTPTTGKSGTK